MHNTYVEMVAVNALRGRYRRKNDPTVQIQWLVNMDADAWIREQARLQNVTPGQVLDKIIQNARRVI